MTPRVPVWIVAIVAGLLGVGPAGAPAAPAGAARGPSSLGAKLRARGSASVRFERVTEDALSGEHRSERGRLVLEVPGRALLEFPRTGERVTLRRDGGEWVQPRLQQVIVFDAAHAAQAGRWWRLLMDGTAPGVTVEWRGASERVFRTDGGAGPDSAVLRVDSGGLPVSLEIPDAGGQSKFRFQAWVFATARGDSAFRQRTPAGYEVVQLP